VHHARYIQKPVAPPPCYPESSLPLPEPALHRPERGRLITTAPPSSQSPCPLKVYRGKIAAKRSSAVPMSHVLASTSHPLTLPHLPTLHEQDSRMTIVTLARAFASLGLCPLEVWGRPCPGQRFRVWRTSASSCTTYFTKG